MYVMSAFTVAKAHSAGPFCLDCSPASLKLFALYPNKSDPQHEMATQAQQCTNMDLEKPHLLSFLTLNLDKSLVEKGHTVFY